MTEETLAEIFDLSQFKSSMPTAEEQAQTDEEYWKARQAHIKDTGTERAYMEGGGPADDLEWIVSRRADEVILHGAIIKTRMKDDSPWVTGMEKFKGAFIYRRTERRKIVKIGDQTKLIDPYGVLETLPVFEYAGPTEHPTEVKPEVKRIIVTGA